MAPPKAATCFALMFAGAIVPNTSTRMSLGLRVLRALVILLRGWLRSALPECLPLADRENDSTRDPLNPMRLARGTELRHRAAITRGPGHPCRNSGSEDQPSVVRNSQQNSQRGTPERSTWGRRFSQPRSPPNDSEHSQI